MKPFIYGTENHGYYKFVAAIFPEKRPYQESESVSLKQEFENGKTIREIAMLHGRSIEDITAKLKSIGVLV